MTLTESLGSEIMVHFRLDAPTVDSGDPDAIEEKTGVDVANAVGRFTPLPGAHRRPGDRRRVDGEPALLRRPHA